MKVKHHRSARKSKLGPNTEYKHKQSLAGLVGRDMVVKKKPFKCNRPAVLKDLIEVKAWQKTNTKNECTIEGGKTKTREKGKPNK